MAEYYFSSPSGQGYTEACVYYTESATKVTVSKIQVRLYAPYSVSSATATITLNGKTYSMNLIKDNVAKNSVSVSQTFNKTTSYKGYEVAVTSVYVHGDYTTTDKLYGTLGVYALDSYTVTYHANGGSGAPSSQTKWYGKTLTLSSTKPTRTGYDFLGWSTSSTATSATYKAGGSYTGNTWLDLYAVWKAVTYTISYNANGGSGAPSSQTKYRDISITLSSTRPSRTGYTFLGWSTSSTATSATYSPGATYKTNSAATLYAVWKIDTYTVSYSANGGSGAPSSQTKTYGKSLTLSSGKPTRSGYTFWHWNTSSTNTGTTYASGGTYTANSGATLYAIWSSNVTFNANGGTGAPATQYKNYRVDLTITTAAPTRAGYVFSHWNTKADGTGTSYRGSSGNNTYTTDSPVTLYAIWAPGVTYDANGGSGAPASQVKTYGTALKLQTGTPTRSGYNFVSWNTAKNGTGDRYLPGGTYTSEESATLYAQWEKGADDPTISSLAVVRSDANGSPSDDGGHIMVTAKWKVDTVYVSGNSGTVTGRYKASSASTWTAFSFSSGASGTSGTAVAIVGGIDTDTQYDVQVTVTDVGGRATSRNEICTRSKFVMDVRKGGLAMGIGSAAPESGLEVGWKAQFDDDVGLLSDLSVRGKVAIEGGLSAPELSVKEYTSDIASSSGNWTVNAQQAFVMGNVTTVLLDMVSTVAITASKSITVSGTSVTVYDPKAQGTIANLSSNTFRPRCVQGFSNYYGIGQVAAGGAVSFTALRDISTSTHVYVGLTFIHR